MDGWGVNGGICDVMKSTLSDCLSQIERVIRRTGGGSLALPFGWPNLSNVSNVSNVYYSNSECF